MPFSAKTLDFLFENTLQNNKNWFREHKAEYQEFVLNPIRTLIVQLSPFMSSVDERMITDPKRIVSRIYKDARYSHDGQIFRDHLWFVFQREKKAYFGLPGFYFSISPNGFQYGYGYYQASRESMQQYREMILNRHPCFETMRKDLQRQKVFSLGGDLYKRSKYPDQPMEYRNYLDRKSVYVECESHDFSLLFSKNLANQLVEDFKQIRSFYDFLMLVEAQKPKEEALQRFDF